MSGLTRRTVVKLGLTAAATTLLAGVVGCSPAETDATTDSEPVSEPEIWLDPATKRIDWERYAAKDAQWWDSSEAVALADKIVEDQQPDGGWRKLIDSEDDQNTWRNSTIDNGTTWFQVRYLAKSYTTTAEERYLQSCVRGIEFLLDTQYESGGWPQITGADGTYHAHITFNDDATTEVTRLLRDIAERSEEEGFAWVEEDLSLKADASFDRALSFILDHQVVIDGRLTAWCQQYDEATLEPAGGRVYEPAAVATWESVTVVKLLQTLPDADGGVKKAIDAALAWFDDVKLQGLRYVRTEDDGYLEEAGPDDYLWARFYDLETCAPIFGDTDGEVYTDVSMVSPGRRAGYDWYGTWPRELL